MLVLGLLLVGMGCLMMVLSNRAYKEEIDEIPGKCFLTCRFMGIGLLCVDKFHLLRFEKKIKMQIIKLYGRSSYDLYRRYDLADQVTRYAIILGITLLLGVVVSIKNTGSRPIENLLREGFMQEDRMESLIYQLDIDGYRESGRIEVRIPAQSGTNAQQMAALEAAADSLAQRIKGENKDLDSVIGPLDLVGSLESGVTILWKSSNTELLMDNGQIRFHQLESEAQEVTLTATIAMGESHIARDYRVVLLKKGRTAQEKAALAKRQIEEGLNQMGTMVREEAQIRLPGQIDGVEVLWYRFTKQTKLSTIFMFGFMIGVLGFILRNRVMDEAIRNRERRIRMAFPGWVNQFSLLMHAGLSYRGAFEKIARDYKGSMAGELVREPLFEEMLDALKSLEQGESEIEVFEGFGFRCQIPEVMRFVSALLQNSRKGGGLLMAVIEQQGKEALQLRMDLAMKRGEAASAGLVLPMGIMLIAIIIIVMAPAAFAFS